MLISSTNANSVANAIANPVANTVNTAGDIGRERGFSARRRESRYRCAAAVCGAVLGLSAPGLEQWYLAWFGVAPLLLFIKSSPGWRTAAMRAFLFGWCYNLVYMHWYLQIHPSTWDGAPFPMLVSALCWLGECARQGAMVAVFGALCYQVRLAPTFVFKRSPQGSLPLPALIFIPLLWVLCLDKIGNALIIQGVPWSMLEYTQYKQIELIQCASIIGGIGLCALILMMNTLIACAFATAWAVGVRKDFSDSALRSSPLSRLTELAFPHRTAAIINTSIVAALVVAVMLGGSWVQEGSSRKARGSITVSCLQGNLARRIDGASEQDLINTYLLLAAQAPAGVCVWPESSIPVVFRQHLPFFEECGQVARKKRQNWIVGTMDRNGEHFFNSALFVDDAGVLHENVYHKRYLVPMAEYIPWWLKVPPFTTIFAGGTMTGFLESLPGTTPCLFEHKDMRISPQLCFDILSAEIVADSIRSGCNLLVSCCNTSWFESSAMSDQMLSFLALRAAEYHRQIAYANVSGASAIVAANGKILTKAPREKSCVITGTVNLYDDRTPFSWWFR